MENTQWKWCYRSIFSAAIFAVICLSAFSLVDGMSGGFAVAFVSFFLAIAGVAVTALFFRRAQVMDSILNGTQPLAHWIYSSDEAEQSARREYADYQERNRAMFFIIGGMLVVAAIIMIIFAGEGGFITGIFLLAFTVFLFIVSRMVPVLVLKNALRAPREAYIAESGIIYEGAVYPFHTSLMRIDGAKFKRGLGKKPSVLIFSFTQPIGLYIRSSFDIEIPVPEGNEEMAFKIADMLGRRAY
ncbi:MAG TPA: hypothetical protein VN455_04125 [Methanotrichaceae archaeon]|nr:hypothetical protein [Methanotrichaceae archaeon]